MRKVTKILIWILHARIHTPNEIINSVCEGDNFAEWLRCLTLINSRLVNGECNFSGMARLSEACISLPQSSNVHLVLIAHVTLILIHIWLILPIIQIVSYLILAKYISHLSALITTTRTFNNVKSGPIRIMKMSSCTEQKTNVQNKFDAFRVAKTDS